MKHSSGGRYTLTHLGEQIPLYPTVSSRNMFLRTAHAALAMTLISDNPPTSEAATQNIYNLSMADCRSSLKEPYNTPEGYPGYALGVYSMHIPVSLFLGDDRNPLPLDKDTLSRAMIALRAAYDAQKRFPAAISFMAQSIEMVTAQIKQAVAANQYDFLRVRTLLHSSLMIADYPRIMDLPSRAIVVGRNTSVAPTLTSQGLPCCQLLSFSLLSTTLILDRKWTLFLIVA